MFCCICGGHTIVDYSFKDCDMIARRRKCLDCGRIIYTTELELKDSKNDYIRLYNEKYNNYRKKEV